MTANELFNSLWMVVLMPATMLGVFCLLKIISFVADTRISKVRRHQFERRDDFSRGYGWQPWFAWRPVKTVAGELVWWDTVYRQIGNTYVDHDDWTWYHYGTVLDVLKDTKQ